VNAIAGSVVGECPQKAEKIRTQLPKRIADQWSEGKTNIMVRWTIPTPLCCLHAIKRVWLEAVVKPVGMT